MIIRKEVVIPYSETIVIMTVFYGHILYMIWKVECYMTIVIYCVMMVQKLESLISILIEVRTIVRLAEMDIEMSMSEVGLGTVIMLKV